MRVQSIQWALVAAPMLFMTASASGQELWADDFESYTAGTNLEYQGGWTAWFLSAQGPSLVSNAQANGGANSAAIISGSDTVYNWDGDQGGTNAPAPVCGEWEMTAQVYVPSGGSGDNYFIVLNNYNGLGLNTEWSVQVQFNMSAGIVDCDCGAVAPVTPAILFDQWVELSFTVDLDQDPLLATDNTFVYYDGNLLGSYPWSGGVFGQDSHAANKIEALDLYPTAGSSTIFWDDISLTQIANGNCLPIGTNYCASTSTSLGGPSVISATGSPSIAANDLVLSANFLPAQPGIFIAGPSMAQIPLFNGFLCVAPQGLQRFATVNNPAGGVITEAVDYGSSAAGGLNVVAGSSYFYQRWNRDPAAGGGFANFSDALEIVHTP
ncbi:MAG: hypothetical protein E2O39_17490 [Planctomycetota bacterium]|nr:MAG: hypothetical protein E2O39_17490 [Planctomycetota bacterium]